MCFVIYGLEEIECVVRWGYDEYACYVLWSCACVSWRYYVEMKYMYMWSMIVCE